MSPVDEEPLEELPDEFDDEEFDEDDVEPEDDELDEDELVELDVVELDAAPPVFGGATTQRISADIFCISARTSWACSMSARPAVVNLRYSSSAELRATSNTTLKPSASRISSNVNAARCAPFRPRTVVA